MSDQKLFLKWRSPERVVLHVRLRTCARREVRTTGVWIQEVKKIMELLWGYYGGDQALPFFLNDKLTSESPIEIAYYVTWLIHCVFLGESEVDLVIRDVDVCHERDTSQRRKSRELSVRLHHTYTHILYSTSPKRLFSEIFTSRNEEFNIESFWRFYCTQPIEIYCIDASRCCYMYTETSKLVFKQYLALHLLLDRRTPAYPWGKVTDKNTPSCHLPYTFIIL